MSIKVCKFGGSSVASADQMRKVKAIVEADPERRFVVPSAPGKRTPDDIKITDMLYACAAQAEAGRPFDAEFTAIRERYDKIVADLGLSLDLGPALDEIAGQIAGGAGRDYAASRGEFLSGRILAELLGSEFVDAAEIVRFNAAGQFLAEPSQRAVAARLSKLERAVVPGFYGRLPDGRVKTFSRGGSDITGAIVARGVAAACYENWTDVSGMLMTDPRIVTDPRPIDVLTYRELRELAYMGATVLHDEAIFPVRQAGIPVHILNTNRPEDPGTRIIRDMGEAPQQGRITGIAGRKDFTLIALEKTLMNAEVGFGRKLLHVLERNGVSWEHMPSGIDTLSIVIKNEVLGDRLAEIVEAIRDACSPDSIETESNIALIATVGRGMSHIPGIAAKLFGALAASGINIRMIDQGSSELNIIVGVDAADFEDAVRAIYDAFS